MRTAFGLLGILATLIVIVWVMAYVFSSKDTAKAISNVQQGYKNAQQFSGRDENNRPADESITVKAERTNGKLVDVVVTAVDAGGAMDKHFGIKRGDTIIEIGMGGGALTPVKEINSVGDVKGALLT